MFLLLLLFIEINQVKLITSLGYFWKVVITTQSFIIDPRNILLIIKGNTHNEDFYHEKKANHYNVNLLYQSSDANGLEV